MTSKMEQKQQWQQKLFHYFQNKKQQLFSLQQRPIDDDCNDATKTKAATTTEMTTSFAGKQAIDNGSQNRTKINSNKSYHNTELYFYSPPQQTTYFQKDDS